MAFFSPLSLSAAVREKREREQRGKDNGKI